MKCRVLLADDHRVVREGLKELIAREGDFDVVGEAANGRTAVSLAHSAQPSVVVMDLAMPDLNGIEATRQILGHAPDVKILVLSMHAERHMMTEVLKAGAKGYLLKDCAAEELVAAIRAVWQGRVYISPGIADRFIAEYLERYTHEGENAFSVLTPREREVLQLLAEGKNTKEIANALFISIKTIETHRQQIMTKLNIHSVAELTKYALREGLTSLDMGAAEGRPKAEEKP